ncbi:hypothetical protein DFP72DRAFT_909025 [Ephemerocybe angulata]|uniref:Uncharacterized protein n=1 Tax=Ephemerocybe angulata TaxID=980116 RepID=A0A8H6M1K1_9AGAR|nr:hypothetical protein DFP72DRAFT_909025 [Tulosesus angulatus]
MPVWKGNDRIDQVCLLAAAWLETLFYGFYACLFTFAMRIMITRRASSEKSTVRKIFFGSIILMFVTATVHECECLTTYRLLRAFGFMLSPTGVPVGYLRMDTYWDNYAYSVMNGIMTWVADALVIYRCYVIWGSNVYVIILPTLLSLAAMAVNLTLYIWWGHQWTSYEGVEPFVNLAYPLPFAQNVLTTGLIAWKIIRQHRRSQSSGLVSVPTNMSLLTVARIIVESAMLYTIMLLMMIIFYFDGHPIQYTIRGALIPSIGIVFLLIAIRVDAARDQLSEYAGSDASVPPWVLDSNPVFRPSLVLPANGDEASDAGEVELQMWSSQGPKPGPTEV